MQWIILITNLFFVISSLRCMDFINKSSSSSEKNKNISPQLFVESSKKEKRIFKRGDLTQKAPRKRRASTITVMPSFSITGVTARFHSKQPNTPKKDNDLINAVHMQKVDLVQEYLPLNDPNEKNSLHNTPLHYAVLLHNLPIAIILLQDYRVNSLTENHQSMAPYQLLDQSDRIKYPILYKKLIVRSRLDQTINALLLTKKIFWKDRCSQDDCFALIGQIRKKINNNKAIKVFPHYATNQFIYNMLLYRSKREKNEINNFLQKKNNAINQPDCYGNTCLHHAAYLRNKKKIRELVANPTVNVFIKNNNKEFAHQIILNSKTRSLLFIRKVLDDCIMKEGKSFFLKFPIQYRKLVRDINNNINDIRIDSECVSALKESINKKFESMKKSQQDDRKLPHRIKFPKYATDYFITYHLVLCIKEEIEKEKNKKIKLLI